MDGQGALENALGILLASLDGANLIHDVAYLGQGLLGNPAMIVLCDEIISYVKHIVAGLDFSPEALGLDTIQRVGPGGNYLTETHTLHYFRKAIWQPSLLNRDNPDTWAHRGSRPYEARVIEKALRILDTHRPQPLPPETRQRLDEIQADAELALARVQFVA
jgi:trimethylamine--corrinoid protein Co-methyltransferase